MDQDDQSLNDSVCNPVSKCAGVRDAKKFVHPGPMSPSLRGKSFGRERVSELEDSAAVAGKLTQTDVSFYPSCDVSIADEVQGSKFAVCSALDCPAEEESPFGSPCPGSKSGWELVRRWDMGKHTGDSVFLEITHMMLVVEQRIAGKDVCTNMYNETGAGLFNATHISGFERSHVRVCFILSCTVISFELTLVLNAETR